MYDESLILDIVRNSNQTILALDLKGRIIYWNQGAEDLFGYGKEEVLGKLLPIVQNKNSYELQTLISNSEKRKGLTYRTQKTNKDGKELDLIFQTNPIIKDEVVIGTSIRIHQTEVIKKVNYLPFNIETKQKEQKRTFNVIRELIILTLYNGKRTINQLASESGINWRTVEKHLTYLIGKKLVAEIFSSEYVRIFELTEIGKSYTEKLKNK
ncbi:PAS domain S-box protein [Candidatus Woesearchaeota archaeon]|nr:PAS domain S-box protein [Candidatus Woesearchaeota archaeon]